MEGYTVFITYGLISESGFTRAIHCNYIKKIQLDLGDPYLQQININFPNEDDFKFLSGNINVSTGFTAQKIFVLAQLVDNTPYSDISEVESDSSQWRMYDVTDQTNGGWISGETITKSQITSTIYKISLFDYEDKPLYDLNYLDYPASVEIDKLSFGDETYFLGTVMSDIEAIVYTTDLSINLLLDEFNTTTNPTWDNVSPVSISEIGIYDENKNLVAIGKLNNPITKDSTIARTIVFAIDF
jgi:hypothetical protein